MSTRIRTGLAIAMAAAAVLLIAGCTAPPGIGQGSDPAPSSNGDGTGVAKEIPATFPDDIPLIDGEVAAGVDVGTGWSVVILTGDIPASYDEATSALEAAGFAEDYSQISDDGSFGQYTNAQYSVQVTGIDQPDYGPSITYLVVVT
jgi:hypothetical protein